MGQKKIAKKYRPIPFWSWNEKLDVQESRRQIREMNQAGLGGFFMHARSGLQTEYMGKEWFENVSVSIEEAKKLGMRPWAYDENGWPSGFGNGKVNSLGIAYQQKYLRMETEYKHKDTAICQCGDHYFYYDVNPFYVDTLDKQVISKFIEAAYKPYFERYGTQIEGFFTDEPQISRDGIPWSFVFEKEYEIRYKENLLEHLEELFLSRGDYKNTRVKFWKMVTELFSESFLKQIYDWCEARGLKVTGHLVLEESTRSQLTANGACMPHYEYFHIPGIDWLGRKIKPCLTAYQVSSAAEQLGKEAVLSETFALCGHNVSFAELKGIYEWQMVRGINLLCQHLEGYSLRGTRKRDYPPALYLQQPWWSEYGKFNEAMAREGMFLQKGEHRVDVLVLHPQSTAWSLFDNGENAGLHELTQNILHTIHKLEQKHIEFHLGDEILIERHGRIDNGRLVIGKQQYSKIICSECKIILDFTKKLLEEFVKSGGTIITEEDLPANDITDNPCITYTKREYDDFYVHFFVNTSAWRERAEITVGGKVLDIYSGETRLFTGIHEFEPWGSLMLLEDKNSVKKLSVIENGENVTLIRPEGMFHLVESDWNSLTLDTCDYYFDGALQEKDGYVLNICERANQLERPVTIHQDYHIQVAHVPEKLFLVCETPEKFVISVNGQKVMKKAEGFFLDQSFRTIDISQYMIIGKNTISFDCDFVQSADFYENLRKAYVFESERNKLAYDFEIEPIYLAGDFSVRTDGIWEKLEKNSMRYHGSFIIDAPQEQISIKHIEMQGYPFFCGSMTLEGELEVYGEAPVLDMNIKGINVLQVEINGRKKTMLTDNRLPLTDFETSGVVKVRFKVTNNLRNLMGPHHLEMGESHSVRPGDFYQEPCVWNRRKPLKWNKGYCFVEMSL